MRRTLFSIIGAFVLLFASNISFGLGNSDQINSAANTLVFIAPNATCWDYYPDTLADDYILYEDSVACAQIDAMDDSVIIIDDDSYYDIPCDSAMSVPQKQFMFRDLPIPCDEAWFQFYCNKFYGINNWSQYNDQSYVARGKYYDESAGYYYYVDDQDQVFFVCAMMERSSFSDAQSLYHSTINKLKTEMRGVRTKSFDVGLNPSFVFVVDDNWNNPIGLVYVKLESSESSGYIISVTYTIVSDPDTINNILND
jgi:hypothetical protein